MMTLTPSATMVGLIQTAYSLPLVFFSILAGAFADTLDRRLAMLGSLVLSFVASLALALAAWSGSLTPPSMLALLFVVGTGVAIFTPSWQASFGDIVPMARLPEAVSLHNMGANLMRTVGPTLGGLLIASAGAGLTFLAGALAYLLALAAVLAWRPAAGEPAIDPERVGAAVGSGLRYLRAAPEVPPLLLRVLAFCTCTVSVVALLPLVARDHLGGGAQTYGLLFGGYGLGAILGGLSLTELRRRRTAEWITRVVMLVNAAAVAMLALGDQFSVALVATTVSGSCWLLTHTLLNSTLQLATPRWMVGRIVAMYLTAAYLGLSLGSWLWGGVAGQIGTRGALALSAVGLVGTFVLALRLRLPAGDSGLQPLGLASEAALLPADLNGHDGPIHIVIDYRIAPESLPDFLRLMDERRRQVMRLGARRWMLLRDAEQASRWTESFRMDNRGDYRRLMTRRSSEHVGLRQRLWQLHRGETKPVVRLMLEKARDQNLAEPMLRA
jgi:predicted MFS family arabinose efflux permease